MKKNGLLLVNLGSPDTPTTPDVKRYLKEFLSDRNVIEMPPRIMAATPSWDYSSNAVMAISDFLP